MSFQDNFMHEFYRKENESDEFYKSILEEVYKKIKMSINEGDKGCFFELPVFRFGMAIGNIQMMTARIQKQLQKENMNVHLVKEGMALIFIDWQQISERTISNRLRYGENTKDDMIDKYKEMLGKK